MYIREKTWYIYRRCVSDAAFGNLIRLFYFYVMSVIRIVRLIFELFSCRFETGSVIQVSQSSVHTEVNALNLTHLCGFRFEATVNLRQTPGQCASFMCQNYLFLLHTLLMAEWIKSWTPEIELSHTQSSDHQTLEKKTEFPLEIVGSQSPI